MKLKPLFFAVLLGSFLSPSLYAAEGCTLNAVQGNVEILRGNEKMAAKQNDTLLKGDKLMTGPDCLADMSMNDLAGCRVLPGSEVEVMGWKPENMSLSVSTGNVILNLAKLPKESSFKVETPTAVATVRGTQFWGRVDKAGPEPVTTFAVREGEVWIEPKVSTDKSAYLLAKGEALDISEAGGVLKRAALPEEMQAMEQADSIATQA